MLSTILFLFTIFIVLPILFKFFFVVEQQTMVVVEFFGKFSRVSGPGLNVKIPLVEKIAGRRSLKIKQLDVDVETKTKDNVFVHVVVSVQYFVLPDKVYEAFYKLDNPEAQITSYVFDTVRAEVPHLKVDEVFEKKDDVANAVKKDLSDIMQDFGYGIIKALVTDINPDDKVKAAMNEINAAERLKVASFERGEADKILKVKAAEAEAESKILQGRGLAGQRKAIIEGLRDSVTEFQQNIPETSPNEVMNLVLMTQYFDTLTDVARNSGTNTIMLPHSPGGLEDISKQIRESIISGGEVNRLSGLK